MENNKLKEVLIKNCICYYFDGIIKLEDFDSDNILLDEKLYENILIHNALYKTLIGKNRIRIGKIDGIIRVYHGTRYLVLFSPEKYGILYNRIRYLIGLKSDIFLTIMRRSKLIQVMVGL